MLNPLSKVRYKFKDTDTEIMPKKTTWFFSHSSAIDMIMEFDPSEALGKLHIRIHLQDVVSRPKEVISGIMLGMTLMIVQTLF